MIIYNWRIYYELTYFWRTRCVESAQSQCRISSKRLHCNYCLLIFKLNSIFLRFEVTRKKFENFKIFFFPSRQLQSTLLVTLKWLSASKRRRHKMERLSTTILEYGPKRNTNVYINPRYSHGSLGDVLNINPHNKRCLCQDRERGCASRSMMIIVLVLVTCCADVIGYANGSCHVLEKLDSLFWEERETLELYMNLVEIVTGFPFFGLVNFIIIPTYLVAIEFPNNT